MTKFLLVQMSGAPGSGKSTVARASGRRTGAAVLDHDVAKSDLIEAGVDPTPAGRASYAALLGQGIGVVPDSPCYCPELLEAWMPLAAQTGACYRYVECVTGDMAELARRLQERTQRPSQVRDFAAATARSSDGATLSGEALFREWIANTQRPTHSYLRFDTARPVADYLDRVFALVEECPS